MADIEIPPKKPPPQSRLALNRTWSYVSDFT